MLLLLLLSLVAETLLENYVYVFDNYHTVINLNITQLHFKIILILFSGSIILTIFVVVIIQSIQCIYNCHLRQIIFVKVWNKNDVIFLSQCDCLLLAKTNTIVWQELFKRFSIHLLWTALNEERTCCWQEFDLVQCEDLSYFWFWNPFIKTHRLVYFKM